jgi:hypothetical protein
MVTACQSVAAGKEQLKVQSNLEEAPQIEHRKGAGTIAALPLGENLSTQRQSLSKIPLQKPITEIVISLSCGLIDGIPASPVSHPWPPTLLEPEGELSPDLAISLSSIRIPCGDFQQRKDPQDVGDPILLYFITSDFCNAILLASFIGILAIAAMRIFFYRSFIMAMLALVPLWVGTCMTLFLMLLLALPFNQANVLYLVLILGEGVEFGIIILTRWQLEESARAIALPASTAKGVALAALTNTVGVGSLMISSHRGTFTLGLLATVGSLCVLWASLRMLPALLQMVQRKMKPPRTLFHALLESPSSQQTI